MSLAQAQFRVATECRVHHHHDIIRLDTECLQFLIDLFQGCIIYGQKIIKFLDVDFAAGGYQVQVVPCRMFEFIRAVKPVKFSG